MQSAVTVQLSERTKWFESDFRRRLASSLARAEAVMAPLCSVHCGQVILRGDPHLGSIAACEVDQPGVSSLILYEDDANEWSPLDTVLKFYIIAHEYGHHLDLLTDGMARREPWEREIRADVLAGCALVLAGEDIAKALELERDPYDGSDGSSALSPPKRSTREAITQGADACRATKSPTLTALALVAQRVAAPVLECRDSRGRSERCP